MGKNDLVRIRIPAAEKERWRQHAAAAGLPLSAWVRTACRSGARGGDDAAVRAELVRLRRALNAIGNNVNQLAHRANAGAPIDQGALDRSAAAIEAMRTLLAEALR
ncbi:plasmid mobilization protein [Marinimicrococcus flavescens]|uniref:Plasmid mobilization relaxosome protein MobC n=1 Tax=Marinimicrococcus flavescens TaxID=3031815 RepID=A0AAP4D5U4_9PROT|nr:plasmid mobilization relaxosome protein MobC [Marinimicrococcus flavescens]